jgi:hypothetical protein
VARGAVRTTGYLTSQPDQRHRRVAPDSLAYMRGWYASVRALGLHAIVFHDELSVR